MKFDRLLLVLILASCALVACCTLSAPAAVELEGWGDLRGFRIDGQLIPVTTNVRVLKSDPHDYIATGHWQVRDIHLTTDGTKQIYTGKIGLRRANEMFLYKSSVEPLDDASAKVTVQITPQQDSTSDGVYFCISAPLGTVSGADVTLLDPKGKNAGAVQIAATQPATDRVYLQASAAGALLKASDRSIKADFDRSRDIEVRDIHDQHGDLAQIRILLHPDDVKKGELIEASFIIKVAAQVDHSSAHIAIDATRRGPVFGGIGGNFVFALDSPDVNYNIDNFHPVWARMAVPLALWQPDETIDPDPQKIADVDRAGSDIRSSLELARKLSQHGIPLIFTLWVPPAWAITNPIAREPYAEGRIVNPAKWDDLCNSIASYLLYAKNQYGVEPKLFSLNETDLGVTIKLTPQQYHDAMARLGACFASHGISTKLLVGDVSNPRPVDFISLTTADPEVMKYAGAISFHSWNGATSAQLAAWHAVAQNANLPLIVAEGGTDSDAYRYPHVFAQTWYAIDEAAMYVDTLASAQPLTVLPWEMTSDYGLIDFHETTPKPLKRFWCLKQLSSTTSPGEAELGVACNQPAIHATALSDPAGRSCAIHLVNTGAAREVTITGLPAGITQLQSFITDGQHDYKQQDPVSARDGIVSVSLPAMSYVTLVTSR
jgi:O-glycosyl hydrolase